MLQVGEMRDFAGGDAAAYLEREIEALREVIARGYDNGTNSGYSMAYQVKLFCF